MRKGKRNVSFHYGEACNKSPSTHLSFLVFLGEQPRIVHPNGWCSAFRTAQRIPPWSTSIHLILRFCSMQKLFRKLGIKRRRSNVLDSYCREISRVAAEKRKNSKVKKLYFYLSVSFFPANRKIYVWRPCKKLRCRVFRDSRFMLFFCIRLIRFEEVRYALPCRIGRSKISNEEFFEIRFRRRRRKRRKNDWKVSFASKNLLTRYYGVSEI